MFKKYQLDQKKVIMVERILIQKMMSIYRVLVFIYPCGFCVGWPRDKSHNAVPSSIKKESWPIPDNIKTEIPESCPQYCLVTMTVCVILIKALLDNIIICHTSDMLNFSVSRRILSTIL